MKTYTKNVPEEWTASEWGEALPNCVTVCDPKWARHIVDHESRIPSNAPDGLKAYVRAEILAHRPEGDDEVRDGDRLWQLRWHGVDRQERCLNHWDEPKREWRNFRAFGTPRALAHAEAWFEKNKPAPKLESNQIQDSDGVPLTLRWFEGQPQWREAGKEWEKWSLGIPSCKAGDAWFRANCPIDRFVTDGGRVLNLKMNDEGEAVARDQSDHAHVWTIPKGGVCFNIFTAKKSLADAVESALYRFRDAERAKWSVTFSNSRVFNRVQVAFDGRYTGCVDINGTHIHWHTGWPSYVRARAEKMWRERETKWETRWYPHNPEGESVEVFRNGSFAGRLTRTGRPSEMCPGSEWPPHILSEARAKFRANYVLARNEVWQRGEVAKVYFDGRVRKSGSDAVLFQENDEGQREHWRLGWFANDAERLEGYDRMRRFYYEEHPGKDLCPDGRPVVFELHAIDGFSEGDVGWARYVDPGHGPTMAIRSRSNVGERWRALQDKLRAWTDKQLAARKGKSVMFECDSWTKCGSSRGPGHALELWKVPPGLELPAGNRFRVTIEPAGES